MYIVAVLFKGQVLSSAFVPSRPSRLTVGRCALHTALCSSPAAGTATVSAASAMAAATAAAW